jgi:general secretion pathway protein G
MTPCLKPLYRSGRRTARDGYEPNCRARRWAGPREIGRASLATPGPARGLTLVELMFVLAILAILTSIAVPSYLSSIYKTQVEQATTDVRALAVKIDLYYTDTGQYPPDLTTVGCTATTCIDPWGYAYQYINHTGMHGNGHLRRDRSLNPLNNDYDLYSIGIDGQTAYPITQRVSQDDVIRAGSGAYYGLASGF